MLKKTSINSHKVESFKYRLNCKERITDDEQSRSTDSWMQIQSILSKGHPVLKGVLERRKDIVVKFGPPSEMHKEYEMGNLIQKYQIC